MRSSEPKGGLRTVRRGGGGARAQEVVKALREKRLVALQGGEVARQMRLRDIARIVEPAVVTNVPEDSKLVREEVFGPVLPVFKVSDLDEAIARLPRYRF